MGMFKDLTIARREARQSKLKQRIALYVVGDCAPAYERLNELTGNERMLNLTHQGSRGKRDVR